MAWIALSVTVAAALAEDLADALLEQGAVAVEMFGPPGTAGEPEAVAEGEGPVQAEWLRVGALLPESADPQATLAAAAAACHLEAAQEFQVRKVEEADWVRITQAQFQPVRVSRRIWVVPSWHAAPDTGAVNIEIDPGLAFGTGTHPTTRLCLDWLDEHLRGGEHVLDYGCGSGILAIAAMKLGAGSATGVDIDPQAVRVSRENAERNDVAASFHNSDSAPRLEADVVLANILANPLRVLAPALAAAVRPGGRVVLSGILAGQADEIVAIYQDWFDMDEAEEEEGWVCLSGTRRTAPS